MRGDPPDNGQTGIRTWWSTPHARGSTFLQFLQYFSVCVYPACAGIHLRSLKFESGTYCLPRMRGDPPRTVSVAGSAFPSTPHARGSTLRIAGMLLNNSVYPACAGIHPYLWHGYMSPFGLPRMRGDPPLFAILLNLLILSTPHARGST